MNTMKGFNLLTRRYGFVHYYELVPGMVQKCEVAYSTDCRKAFKLPANFFHFLQREFGKKAVTKCAFHAGKMVF